MKSSVRTLKCFLRAQYWKMNPTMAQDAMLIPEAGGMTAVPENSTGILTNLNF